ncbi:calcium/calmodulin-regulated receptor-like kinase 2 isoform X2 [Elaeis guineensis]|uniref:calcium/calmodulin-regulated receptor-like kinase 2 isoform X2 n=1 Tax=Elaeis guineensis var. tenera TaxID=51953 RepID=UPI00057A3A08
MGNRTDIIVTGVSVGVAIGILVAFCAYIAIRFYRKHSHVRQQPNELSAASLPIRANGIGTSIDSSASLSVSDVLHQTGNRNTYWGQRGHQNKDLFVSISGIPRYSYKDIQKATQNFTTILGQGSFGPVYKAVMPTSEVVAVKVLAVNSRQGEREFQTEVVLLSRLHHRNLVNLVGYCVDKSQRILVYEFMSNGNLANLLYGDGPHILSWEERLQIALDVSHGIEYLHEGVADFGLSKEEVFDGRKSGLKGTYGYMDPEYMSTNKLTKKSDIYSFGIILFELITAINPQQGLMEYINLAAIDSDGKPDWDEILDRKLVGKSNPVEVRLLADIAYRCLHKIARKRPSIADVTQAIAKIRQWHLTREDTVASSVTDVSGILKRLELQQLELSTMTSMKEYPSPKA